MREGADQKIARLTDGSISTLPSEHVELAAPPTLTFSLVTIGQPITDSGNQLQRVFIEATISLGAIDTRKFRVTLSHLPDRDTPFVIGDTLTVNGRTIKGFAGLKSEPKLHLGEDPIVSYIPIDAQDISGDLREDGKLYIAALDLGGWAYCCSQLYLRVSAR